jgi:hypothetical protein
MSRVSIARDALRELRERIASSRFESGVCIIGPLEDRAWPSNDLEEAWQLEKLYGKPQRWSLHLMPLGGREQTRGAIGRNVHVEEVDGIPVEVWTPASTLRLRIELRGDALHVYEIDA